MAVNWSLSKICRQPSDDFVTSEGEQNGAYSNQYSTKMFVVMKGVFSLRGVLFSHGEVNGLCSLGNDCIHHECFNEYNHRVSILTTVSTTIHGSWKTR